MLTWFLSIAISSFTFPTRLSQISLANLDCFEYEVQSPLWSDGLSKSRKVCVPNSKKIHWESDQDFVFPIGTFSFKEFSAPQAQGSEKRVETRVSVLTNAGWKLMGYRWLDEGANSMADAIRVDTDEQVSIPIFRGGAQRNQNWNYPSEQQCLLCHQTNLSSLNGLRPSQLSKQQLQAWISNQKLEAHPTNQLAMVPELPKVTNPQLSIEERARSYLHGNCAHCHSPGSQIPLPLNLNFSASLDEMNAIEADPLVENFGIENAKLIARGSPERSVLFHRMGQIDYSRMPYLGSSELDLEGMSLVRDWIKSLPTSD
jgi:hypothetical protein